MGLAKLGEHPRLLGRRRMAAFLRSTADELEERHIPYGMAVQPVKDSQEWHGPADRLHPPAVYPRGTTNCSFYA